METSIYLADVITLAVNFYMQKIDIPARRSTVPALLATVSKMWKLGQQLSVLRLVELA